MRPFASIAAPGLIDGIAFDETGTFGFRLLVVTTRGRRSAVDAISCHGAVRQVTASAHRVEGGIAVAPMSFGRFAGDLIASDELGGGIWAVTPTGRNLLVAASGLPHGPDTGVESEAFVPAGRFYALLADRLTPGNPHPGDNVLLRARSAVLFAAGCPRVTCSTPPRAERGLLPCAVAIAAARCFTSPTAPLSPTPRGTSRSFDSYRWPKPTRWASRSTIT